MFCNHDISIMIYVYNIFTQKGGMIERVHITVYFAHS